jgi:hypothetical protein
MGAPDFQARSQDRLLGKAVKRDPRHAAGFRSEQLLPTLERSGTIWEIALLDAAGTFVPQYARCGHVVQ